MNVSINLETLYEYGLTSSEYIVLFLLRNNKLNNAKFNYEKPLKSLQDKGFVNNNKAITITIPEDLFAENKIEDLEMYWEQFKALYPKRDGPRRLHDSPTPCKTKYLKLLKKNVDTQDQIIIGINNETNLRKEAELAGDFFPAPKLMSTYINNKSWEGYLDVDTSIEKPDIDLI
jgi:hypothetical protein